jgi:type IV pilus assembly protein PilM
MMFIPGLGRKKTKNALVGLDIGSSSIKAVQLKKRGRELELAALGLAELGPDAVVDGAIMDALGVSSAIQKIFADNGIQNQNVASSVSGSPVIVKRINVAAGSEAELPEAVPAEAQRQLSSNISELNLTYQLLGPSTALKALDVLLVAARREKVSEYTGVLNQAGKNPVVIDVDALAVQNAFETAYPQERGRTIALLNIGASLTNVDVVRDGVPLFTRDISVGGNL